ncbi:MAG: cytochrome c biogenesis protein ResB [Elusimicrobiota bacterium]|jgi:hypothetical protein
MTRKVLRAVSDMRVTMACTLLLMVVVLFCTFAQTRVGVYAAVSENIRSFFIWWSPHGTGFRIPVFPGGALIGVVYLANLLASFFVRLPLEPRRSGLWLVHLGIALLVAGEFVAGAFSVEARMALRVGETRAYAEADRRSELAVLDSSDPAFDRVLAFDEALLARGGELRRARWPFSLRVLRWEPNAGLEPFFTGVLSPAVTQGKGRTLAVRPLPRARSDEASDEPAAWVEVLSGGRSLGVWLLSRGLEEQSFSVEGRDYRFLLREKRLALPFSLTLLEFRRETYPGSDIPKSFASSLRLHDPGEGADRDALVSMNNPLRHRGLSFYQASYGEEDRLSVLQVVRNPGRLLPYLACVLAGFGLLLHFGWLLLFPRRAA